MHIIKRALKKIKSQDPLTVLSWGATIWRHWVLTVEENLLLGGVLYWYRFWNYKTK